jgi:AraC family transcriptional regulator
MGGRLKQIHSTLTYVAQRRDEDVSLARLAGKAHSSPFHLHRLFSAAMRETPKKLALRLRLEDAASRLLVTRESVLDIALNCGFQSHEVFCRAFRRRFGMTPSRYRERGFAAGIDDLQAKKHAVFVASIGPCVGLYHFIDEQPGVNSMQYVIKKIELSPQPVLVGRRRVKRSEIAATVGAVLGHVFKFAQQHGIAVTGLPFTRYSDIGPGLLTVEPGMRIAAPSDKNPIQIDPEWTVAAGEAEVQADMLPGGFAAVTLHVGAYDRLPDAYGALEQWIESEGLLPAGAPWESYITDPAESPDPKDWKTEVFWPVKKRG